jgi:TonB family protein
MARGPDLHWQGWLASFVLHAAAVTLVLVAPFHFVIDATAPFQWDVRLVEPDTPAPQTIEAGAGGNGSPMKPRRESQEEPTHQPLASAKTANRPNTSVPRPVETARPVQRQTQFREIVTREELPVKEIATQPTNRQVTEVESSARVTEPIRSEPVTKESVEHAAVEKLEERQQYETMRSEVREVHTTDREASQSGTVSAEAAAIVTPGIVQNQGALTRPDAVEGASVEPRPSPILKSAVSSHAADEDTDGGKSLGQARSISKSEIVEKAAAQRAEVSSSGEVSHAIPSSEARTQNPGPMASASVSGSGKGTGQDYGWLKRLLWERINHIKSYSNDAVENEWEGRVVMVVTIRADGRIDEVGVAEGSGNDSLDREAAELIRRASPLELDRALGAARVKFRVPISFGLE